MSYKVLARKWRPQKFQEVIGQEHVTRSLQNAVLRSRIGQAYVLAGTRGIGKTSVARILAKAIRCQDKLPDGNACEKCDCCLDSNSGSSMNIIEIDGASNNGVDNIRELIEDVHYLPTLGQYKVYIIDEVHMVTTQAFNALLKTLEEPPAHIVFIFATTEPHKLLGTVLSRCQRFDFRHVDVKTLEQHIQRIGESEGITFENRKLLTQISIQGKGSVRDTLSLLDQVLSYSDNNNVTEETLVVSLGIARLSAIRDLTESILLGDLSTCISTYRQLISENIESQNIFTALLDYLYDVIENIDNVEELYTSEMINKGTLDSISAQELFWIYETLAKDSEWIFRSIDPMKVAEISLQKMTLRRTFLGEEKPVQEQIAQTKKKKIIEKTLPPKKKQTWEDFLNFLHTTSPASAANLEQGNIVTPLEKVDEIVSIKLGFDGAGAIFMDYLQERERLEKLKKELGDFFEVKTVEIFFEKIDEEKKNEYNFKTRAEIRNEDETRTLEERKKSFHKKQLIQEAEDLFKTEVDKIIITKENK